MAYCLVQGWPASHGFNFVQFCPEMFLFYMSEWILFIATYIACIFHFTDRNIFIPNIKLHPNMPLHTYVQWYFYVILRCVYYHYSIQDVLCLEKRDGEYVLACVDLHPSSTISKETMNYSFAMIYLLTLKFLVNIFTQKNLKASWVVIYGSLMFDETF